MFDLIRKQSKSTKKNNVSIFKVLKLRKKILYFIMLHRFFFIFACLHNIINYTLYTIK